MNRNAALLGVILALFAVVAPQSALAISTAGWLTYNDPSGQYSISYPSNWTVDPTYINSEVSPAVSGVRFGIPASLTVNSNISTILTGVTVQTVPGVPSRRGACNPSKFLQAPENPNVLHQYGHTWNEAEMGDSGIGHIRLYTVYAVDGSFPCLAVVTISHRLSNSSFPMSSNQVILMDYFDTIRSTLVLH